MKRTTASICLSALLVSCSMDSVLRADELVMRDNFFIANESRHQWINERNGRTGLLTVHGALLLSPCTLETNEVNLPLKKIVKGNMTRYMLKLNLLRCGYGGKMTSNDSVAARDGRMVMQSTLQTGEGERLPDSQVVSTNHAVVYSGENQLTYWLNESLQQSMLRKRGDTDMNSLGHPPLLRLHLDYE
ncbi:pilus-assembly fibrillin subunit [Escherichia coli O8:H49]